MSQFMRAGRHRVRWLAVLSTAGLVGAGLVATSASAQIRAANQQSHAAEVAIADDTIRGSHGGGGPIEPIVTDLAGQAFTDGTYIVQLAEQPVAGYDGHLRGYSRTRPAEGKKVDIHSSSAKKYEGYLKSRSDALLKKVGNPKKLYDYTTVFPGFAAQLTAKQAEALANDPAVRSIEKDKLFTLDAAKRTSEFLGLESTGGAWDRAGGRNAAGAGIVIGDIDSGIWPELPSFDSMGGTKPAKFKGTCDLGTDTKNPFPASRCGTDKLVGARYYVAGFGASRLSPDEFLSPRDGSGHGTHTASTAGGNFGPRAVMPDGNDLGEVSGMAPAASIAAYKVCWEGTASSGCAGADLTAAINQAVADGVDVINYSIGSTSESSYFGSQEVAFLYAAQAGVFVSASAGNSGPGVSTLDHPSPWLTTVAASTYSSYEGTVQFGATVGGKTSYVGASTTPGVGEKPLVDAADVKKSSASAADAKLCILGTLDPAKVAGKIVLCDRGTNARVEKSMEVANAGGVGMVLLNPANQGVNGDYHFVPTVHLEYGTKASYDAIHAYAHSGTGTAAILAGVGDGSTGEIPRVIEFSSRGPSKQGGGDVLKPDIAAPGVDVLAGVAPASNYGRTYDYMSGTSMAAPHITGLAALLKQAHPDWSPMMIKSSLMTTAYDTRGGTTSPFDQGAGHVDPNKALNPGLVYDAGEDDWWAFLNGQGCSGCPTNIAPIKAHQLNQASIAVGSLAGTASVTRTVTNVGDKATYTASISGLAGVGATVSPSTITLEKGEKATFTVTFARTTAPLNAFATGSLTWTSDTTTVRSPIAVKPIALAVPAQVTANVSSAGTVNIPLTPGDNNVTVTNTLRGLVGATPVEKTVGVNPSGVLSLVTEQPWTRLFTYTAPGARTQLSTLRVQTSGNHKDDDVDLYCVTGSQQFTSATEGPDELVMVSGVPGGTTFVCLVHGYSAGGGRDQVPFTLTQWWVGQTAAATSASVPATVTSGAQGVTVNVPLSWSGLNLDQRYFGWVDFSASGASARTYVSIGYPVGEALPDGSGYQVITADVSGSPLTMQVGGSVVTMPPVTLTGMDQRVSGALNAVTVVDPRGTGQGWNLTGQVSDFVGPNGLILADNLGWAPTASTSSDNSLPIAPGSESVVEPGATRTPGAGTGLADASTLCRAQDGRSGGAFTCGGALTLGVPGATKVGTYTGVLTLTLV